MPKPKQVELVLATGHKIDDGDSLVVFVDPQYADFVEGIYQCLSQLTGHDKHTVIPVPADAVKIFKVRHSMMVSVDPRFADKLIGEESKNGGNS